jgi:hypothetical protein
MTWTQCPWRQDLRGRRRGGTAASAGRSGSAPPAPLARSLQEQIDVTYFVTQKKHNINLTPIECTTLCECENKQKLNFLFFVIQKQNIELTTTYRIHHPVQEKLDVNNFCLFVTQRSITLIDDHRIYNRS